MLVQDVGVFLEDPQWDKQKSVLDEAVRKTETVCDEMRRAISIYVEAVLQEGSLEKQEARIDAQYV